LLNLFEGAQISAINANLAPKNYCQLVGFRFHGSKLRLKELFKNKSVKREVVAKNSHLGKRAIVVGVGLGGLSAARVLPNHFDEVTILDRDELPEDASPRPGVPQGKHPHLLLGV
jgi:hypothetical protein